MNVRSQPQDVDGSVAVYGGQMTAGRTEAEFVDAACRWTDLYRTEQFCSRRVPKVDGTVVAGTGETRTIRAESDREDNRPVGFIHDFRLAARFQVPHQQSRCTLAR